MTRILFVCSQNRLRSPTAEQVFSAYPQLDVASAGTNRNAENPLTPDLIAWADIVFVMEKTHRNKIREKYRMQLHDTRVICLDIPDDYDYMDPELVALLKRKVGRHLPGVDEQSGERDSA